MAVAVHDSRESSRLGLEIELVNVVQNVNCDAAGFENSGFGQFLRPRAAIHIATNGDHWRNLAQAVKNRGVADIARVNDVVGTSEGVNRFRSQQAVGIGDNADGYGRDP